MYQACRRSSFVSCSLPTGLAPILCRLPFCFLVCLFLFSERPRMEKINATFNHKVGIRPFKGGTAAEKKSCGRASKTGKNKRNFPFTHFPGWDARTLSDYICPWMAEFQLYNHELRLLFPSAAAKKIKKNEKLLAWNMLCFLFLAAFFLCRLDCGLDVLSLLCRRFAFMSCMWLSGPDCMAVAISE